MNLRQAFKIAIKSIAAKKGRSALTMLGIIIGLSAVIILVSFAKGQNKWLEDYYASMVDNSISIQDFSFKWLFMCLDRCDCCRKLAAHSVHL